MMGAKYFLPQNSWTQKTFMFANIYFWPWRQVSLVKFIDLKYFKHKSVGRRDIWLTEPLIILFCQAIALLIPIFYPP